jgi:hypothetical protein
MNTPILDCKVGDIIQYISQGSPTRSPWSVLAVIVSEKLLRGQHMWVIQPIGAEDTRQYHIPTTSIVWEKLSLST